jgi:hypothetical protein
MFPGMSSQAIVTVGSGPRGVRIDVPVRQMVIPMPARWRPAGAAPASSASPHNAKAILDIMARDALDGSGKNFLRLFLGGVFHDRRGGIPICTHAILLKLATARQYRSRDLRLASQSLPTQPRRRVCNVMSPTAHPPATPRPPRPRRIAQFGMIAFGTHFEVALVKTNHSRAVPDGHDRRLR